MKFKWPESREAKRSYQNQTFNVRGKSSKVPNLECGMTWDKGGQLILKLDEDELWSKDSEKGKQPE